MSSFPDLDWYLEHVVLPAGPPEERGRLSTAGRWQSDWATRARDLPSESPERDAYRWAAGQGFVITRGQAMATGLPPARLRSLLRRGIWTPQRRNVMAVLPRIDDRAVTAALAASAAALAWPGAVVSHDSAAVLHGLPVRHPPTAPMLTVVSNSSTGRHPSVHTRRADLTDDEQTSWFGTPLTSAARTVSDIARHDRHAGLMAADAACRDGLTSVRSLVDAAQRCRGWPGSRGSGWVSEHADP